MKKKLNGEAGFTLMEMLAATVILILLTMMLGIGLQMTVSSYQKITAQSEVDLLLSTAMDALADDLRFARDVEEYSDDEYSGTGAYIGEVSFTYTSDSFAGKIHLEIDTKTGQIMAFNTEDGGESMRFLSAGAYGAGKVGEERAYKVTKMEITHDEETSTFKISLEMQATADQSIKASGEVIVRCLNKM